MSVGKLGEFDVRNGQWSSYIDRVEMYFKANGIAEDKRLPTLIAIMGDETYEVLVNLASPRKPSELAYAAAVELMRQHLQPTPSALAERYRFRQKRQGAAEDMSTYVAELKKLARNCKFGTNLSENLRDQFVCGLRSDVARQRLFAEDDDITFAAAVKLACSLEAAERDAAAVERPSTTEAAASAVHALEPAAGRRQRARVAARGSGGGASGVQSGGTQRSGTERANCAGCGARDHDYGSCRFRLFVCSKCQRTGHLRRVCPEYSTVGSAKGGSGYHRNTNQKKGGFNFGDVNSGSSSEDDDIEERLNLLGLNKYKPVSVAILIDNKLVNMEIDTGTAISCISKATYDTLFPHFPMEKDNTVLRFYDGSKLKPMGIIRPLVRHGDYKKKLELFIIEGGTTSLVGRQWLAELQINLPNFSRSLDMYNAQVHIDKEICKLIDRYSEVFSGGLGRYLGGKATLRVRDDATPVFRRARPLPYAMRERVDAELDAMLRDNVIEPVDCSDWASPLVPVNKADGTLRICADYKATLNPVLLIDRYPLPRIEDVLVGLNGAQYFSKIDLSQAYNQIELDESKKYTVINTHRGLFRYNRLVFGLSSSVGVFQRIMTNLFGSIPNVQVFLDDVIIGGKTKTEHLRALNAVFEKLVENGLKLEKSKCVFLADQVSYLGYIVSKEGIKADKSKIEAILNIRQPGNVSDLRSFLGMVNFFSKFVRNFSTLLAPLNNLLRKGVEWVWDVNCERSFLEVKRVLTSTDVLAHYDPKKPLVVTCDASGRGVGGVLAQCGPNGERPVAYASRSLTPAEKNYSQIHREALAIVYCMKKFHQYLYGRKFVLRTDHKPLVSIFGPNSGIPAMTASRMQRWAVILSAYDYEIEYVKTNENCADGLSRLPTGSKAQVSVTEVVPEQTYLHFAQDALLLDYNELKQKTAEDMMLAKILSFIRDGWPESCDILGMQPYFNRRSELYEELGCVMWGHRVVIPEGARKRVLELIHEPHMGVVKSKALARSYVWWPGIDEAVERVSLACPVCAAHADAPPRASPCSWTWPARAWSRLHLDFMGPVAGKTYLVAVDATTKWLEVFPVPSTAASFSINRLSELFSRFGNPRQIVTDNGPPFTSSEFAKFIREEQVEHIFTAPYHPASNGAAENAVKTLKRVIKKALTERKDVERALHTFLKHYRNSEHATTGESPATLMQGRRLRTKLDALIPDRDSRVDKLQKRQVERENGTGRKFQVGQDVWFRQYLKGEKWVSGKVVSATGTRDFTVSDSGGKHVHRHIDQLKRRLGNSPVVSMDSVRPLSRSLVVPMPVRSQSERGQSEVPPDSSGVLCTPHAAEPPRTPSPVQGPIASCSRDEPGSGQEEYVTPPATPVPRQPRPIRACRIGKEFSYKE